MAEVTYFVVQPFVQIPDTDLVGLGQAVQAPNSHAARRTVAQLPNGMVGAVAFSRTGDPEEGEWADAEIIAQNGAVPEEFLSSGLPW